MARFPLRSHCQLSPLTCPLLTTTSKLQLATLSPFAYSAPSRLSLSLYISTHIHFFSSSSDYIAAICNTTTSISLVNLSRRWHSLSISSSPRPAHSDSPFQSTLTLNPHSPPDYPQLPPSVDRYPRFHLQISVRLFRLLRCWYPTTARAYYPLYRRGMVPVLRIPARSRWMR